MYCIVLLTENYETLRRKKKLFYNSYNFKSINYAHKNYSRLEIFAKKVGLNLYGHEMRFDSFKK